MSIALNPETEAKLDQFASESGIAREQLVEDAITEYLAERGSVRAMLDRRFDEMESGAVRPLSLEEVRRHFEEKSAVRRTAN